jgi:hypothetical protein
MPMVMLRYKTGLKQTLTMELTVLRELRRIDSIDRDYFLKCMKEDFKGPVVFGKIHL